MRTFTKELEKVKVISGPDHLMLNEVANIIDYSCYWLDNINKFKESLKFFFNVEMEEFGDKLEKIEENILNKDD